MGGLTTNTKTGSDSSGVGDEDDVDMDNNVVDDYSAGPELPGGSAKTVSRIFCYQLIFCCILPIFVKSLNLFSLDLLNLINFLCSLWSILMKALQFLNKSGFWGFKCSAHLCLKYKI